MTRTPPRSAAERGPGTDEQHLRERLRKLDTTFHGSWPRWTYRDMVAVSSLLSRAGATAAVPLDAGLNDAIWHVIRVMGNDEGCAELAEAARHLANEYGRIFPPRLAAPQGGAGEGET